MLLTSTLLVACQAPGVRAFANAAAQFDFTGADVVGSRFTHRVYANRALREAVPGAPLQVYIDGDGIPWLGPDRVALEPTARNPLIVRLMAQDDAAALLLGRPCYLGVKDSACNPWMWSHGRYSEEVVDSMVSALQRLLRQYRPGKVTLIGYSGGGVLAMLMAPRVAQVDRVITLAANLDVAAWTAYHGYSPLAGSLDPAREPPLPARIAQWHWVGADDTQVPPSVVRDGLRRQPTAHLQVLPGVDHACCWEARWRTLLTSAAQ